MESIKEIFAILTKALEEGKSVKISADEITIKADEATASALEITME